MVVFYGFLLFFLKFAAPKHSGCRVRNVRLINCTLRLESCFGRMIQMGVAPLETAPALQPFQRSVVTPEGGVVCFCQNLEQPHSFQTRCTKFASLQGERHRCWHVGPCSRNRVSSSSLPLQSWMSTVNTHTHTYAAICNNIYICIYSAIYFNWWQVQGQLCMLNVCREDFWDIMDLLDDKILDNSAGGKGLGFRV